MNRWGRGTLVVMAVMAAVAASADEPDTDLTEAKRLYQSAEFPSAVQRLRHAIQALEPQRQLETARVQLTDAYLHLGLAYCAMGDVESAKDAFRNVVQLDPERRLDEDVYAPKVVDLYERARLSVPVAAAAESAPAVRPPAPALRPRERRFHFELDAVEGRLLDSREIPHPDARVLGLVDRAPYTQSLSGSGVRASVRLPGRWGRLDADYRYLEGEQGMGLFSFVGGTDFGTGERTTTDLEYSGFHTIRYQSAGLNWSKPLSTYRRFRLHRELGYRFLHLKQDVRERLNAGPQLSSTYDAMSRLSGHGFRAGLAAEFSLTRKWHLDAGFGLTVINLGGRRSSGGETVEGTSRSRAASGPPEVARYWTQPWDARIRIRYETASPLHFTAGYAIERSLSAGVTPWFPEINQGGLRFSAGYRFGR